jgi:regulator of protease activity HflC (stomatin/prohibitin superfamily)
VGVVTELVGDDILAPGGAKDATTGAGFLVKPGAKGVSSRILKEGTHRLNPFVYAVSIVNIQSQRFELSGADAISFLTLDGFTVSAEGTLEFNLDVEKVALLSHEVGDMDDILQKIVLPAARGFSRIEGSKKNATDFIVGESRQAFQNSLEKYLKDVCRPWGVSLNSVLIRDIFAPQEVAAIIRQRELAVQEGLKIEQQIVQAKSQAELERQKALAAQNSARVAAETDSIRAKISAEQRSAEQVIAAQTKLEVAARELKAAQADAAAKLTEAEGERKVVEAQTKAEADVLRQEVAAYGGEGEYVRAKLYGKTAPKLRDVVTADAPGEIFGLPVRGTGNGERGTPSVQQQGKGGAR